jgi:hypothetical protein
MKLRDRLWCWWWGICSKHFVHKGVMGCIKCWEKERNGYDARLARLKKEVLG